MTNSGRKIHYTPRTRKFFIDQNGFHWIEGLAVPVGTVDTFNYYSLTDGQIICETEGVVVELHF